LGYDQSKNYNREIKLNQIRIIYNLNIQKKINDWTETENLEKLVQELCKSFKSLEFKN
jgi:hypothetical protein